MMVASTWLKGLLLFVCYVVSAKLGLTMSPLYGVATLVWAPAGLALAAVVLGGWRLWPFIAAAAFVVNATVVSPLTAAGIAVGNTLSAIVGAQLLRHWGPFQPSLERLWDVARLVVAGALFAPMLAASGGAVTLWLSGIVPAGDLLRVWSVWWIGDMLGVLLVAPAVLTWGRPSDWQRESDLRQGALLLAFATICIVAFGGWLRGILVNYSLTYFIFPLLIWAAVYFGPRGAATASLVVASAAIVATAAHYGAFVTGSLTDRLLNLQSFMGVVSVTAMALSAITAEQRQSQLRLRKSERLLNESQFLTRIGSWEWDVPGDCIIWSPELYAIYGTTPAEFDHTVAGFLRFIHPDDRRRVFGIVQRFLQSPEPQAYEERIIRPDGSVRILASHGRAVHGADGRPLRVIGTCQDVTEQKQQEALLSEQTHLLTHAAQQKNAILQSLSEGLLLVSRDTHVIQANAAACDLLRRKDGTELVGKPVGDMLGIAISSRRMENQLRTLSRPDGSVLSVRLTTVPVGDSLTVVTLRDVTQEEAVARMKSEFVSLASHELRTPLTIVSGYLELLLAAERYALSPERRTELMQRIHLQIVRLGRIVDDLLNVARIEHGRMLPTCRPLALDGLIRRVLKDIRPAAAAKTIGLTLDLPVERLPDVHADADHVEQVVRNLLDNAVKYSPAGNTVTVTIRSVGAFVRIAVIDRGVGIPAAEQPHLFAKFHRIWRSETLAERGTGLGLYIARLLTEAQGGAIVACSEPGQGSTFAFTLPIAGTDAAKWPSVP